MGRTVTCCIDRESTTETELPAGKARRPDGLRSADPKLLRLGGPGSMQSQESSPAGCGGAATDAADGPGLNMADQNTVSDPSTHYPAVFLSFLLFR